MKDILLHIAQIVCCTEAEGPGRRFALWFQGCPLRCPGCCNPEMLPFAGGRLLSVAEILNQIRQARRESMIEGVTLLGGEPFAHAPGAAILAKEVKRIGLSVMVFSGYTIEEITSCSESAAHTLLANTDILVDGPYLRDQPERQRRWIGSKNQRVHFLTDRYHRDDRRWQQGNTLEIRLVGNEISINGFPAPSAVGLWKRLTST